MASAGIQKSDNSTFIRTAAEVLGWKDLSSDLVMDVGCGVGRTSAALIAEFPEVRQVIAIDVSEQRLAEARAINSHPRLQYECADMRNKFTLARWAGDITKAVSVFCFNCLDDERTGYENLFLLLKPGGEAAILQSLKAGYYDFLDEIRKIPKWRDYFSNLKIYMPASHFTNRTSQDYKRIFEEVGFEVVKCYDEENAYGRSYTTDEECKHVVCHSCQLMNVIPEELREEFKEEAFQVFIKHNQRDSEGRLTMSHTSFSVFLRKPDLPPTQTSI